MEQPQPFLNSDELYQLTHAKRAATQKRILRDNGIYFLERIDGSLAVTWYHVNHPLSANQRQDDEGDFQWQNV